MGKIYTQKFRSEWKNNPKLKDWIEEVTTDNTLARCKYCKSSLNAKYCDLIAHSLSKKHKTCSELFSSARQQKLPFQREVRRGIQSSIAEGAMSLFVTCLSAIRSVDHLTDMNKMIFKNHGDVDNIRLHRTKCSGVIQNILYPHFQNILKMDIKDSPYSLLIDESTDISVSKKLGVCIIYFSHSQRCNISTFLKLEVLEAGNAESIVQGLKSVLRFYDLDIQNLRGIGCDNASVMVGQHNGVHAILSKEVDHLILIRCVCHSIQLSVSAATYEVLPDHLEYLLSETYSWFCKSSQRQLSYQILYNTINNGVDPLKIVKVAQTRWLSIEVAVSRILEQWLELKQHFQIASSNEKCYKAKTLFNMYNDVGNELILIFLKPVLSQAQHVNKMFQSNSADPVKLLDDLIVLIKSLAGLVITSDCEANILTTNIKNYLHPRPYLGHVFEEKIKTFRLSKSISIENEKKIRGLCVSFIIALVDQLKERLPDNIDILKNISLISPTKCLSAHKGSLTPLAKLLKISNHDICKIEVQWNKLHLIEWQNTKNTMDFWKEVDQYLDASGVNPFYELLNLAKCLLILPWSNGEVERSFSQLNIVKNSHRNKMGHDMINAILTIRSGLRRLKKCCYNYELPRNVLDQIGTLEAYKSVQPTQTSQNISTEELLIDFEDEDFDIDDPEENNAVISIPEI